jgi:N-acyl-D-aspartate/D-glutamate deacylase
MPLVKRLYLVWSLLAGCQPQASEPQLVYDTVILHGRVMDPETNLDAVRNVGLRGGQIAAITDGPLVGRSTIEARNLVVAPGFVDLHSHGDTFSVDRDLENLALKAADGVTSSLELEVGTGDVDRWYHEREGKALIHYGVSIGHIHTRMAVLGDPPRFLPPVDSKANTREATPEEIAEIKRRIEHGLRRGAVAVGFGIQYTSGASRWEILEAFGAAAPFGASCHVHLRHNGRREPNSSTQALEEVIAAAAVTGAPLHVVHIHSTSIGSTPRHLDMIAQARARGLDVTTECYPYTAGMTNINSGVFAEGWRENVEIDYKDLMWVATGERLTEASFLKYRKEGGGLVAIFSIPESAVRAAVQHPLVLIASDGLLENGKGHPRNAGTYARILGRFVREDKVLPLMEALRKISLMPAQRLEHHAPMFKKKGRLQVGADADLTVFDPERVIDRATYEEPEKTSEGIPYVFVGGTRVVAEGKPEPVHPGRALRAPIRE